MGDSDFILPTFTSFTKKWHSEPYDTISPSRPSNTAVGKNVIVTGGGTGIGKAIAIAFAQAGATSVAILGRRKDRLLTAAKEIGEAAAIAAAVGKKTSATKVLYRVVDITKKSSVDEAFKSVAAEVGKLHVMVSNAGLFPTSSPVATTDVDVFMSGFETNVRGALNAVQAFIPVSAAPSPDSLPTVLNVSTAVHIAPMPNSSAYIVSKAAGHKMMDFVATENPGLHLVNVSPGVIRTEMAEGTGAASTVEKWDSPALPGSFCVWLTSPEAKFLKSKMVWANWDADEMIARKEEIQNSRLLTWLLDGVPM